MNCVRKRIRDQRFLTLLWRIMKAEYTEQGLFCAASEGVPKGGVLSPLPSNIMLHEFDSFLEEGYLSRKVRAARWRTDRDAIGDRVTQQMVHGIAVHPIRGKIAVLGNPLQQALALQKAANAPGDGMGQLPEFVGGRRLDPVKPDRSVRVLDIHPIEEQHVEMDIGVERRASRGLDRRSRERPSREAITALSAAKAAPAVATIPFQHTP